MERTTALIAVVSELAQASTLDDLMRRAVELGRERLSFERIGIWLRGGEARVLQGTFGIDERGEVRDERSSRIALGESPQDRAFLAASPQDPGTGWPG